MKIKIENLGVLRQAEFELGDLTIICGCNNTGKTYATYALYGFLDFWWNGFSLDLPKGLINDLFDKGSVTLPIRQYEESAKSQIVKASRQYSKPEILAKVFASKESHFTNTKFNVEISYPITHAVNNAEFVYGSVEKNILQIKSNENHELEISLLVEKNAVEDIPPPHILEDMISDAVKKAVFSNTILSPFIASAERTGSAIFQKELDFTRNRLIEIIGDKSTKDSRIKFLLGKFTSDYPIPVKRNVDFIRELPGLSSKESDLLKQHPEVLDEFSNIIGGEYKVTKDGDLYYIPKYGRRVRLSMVESSSAVRSLLDVGFYLRHVASKGDLLIIDEPELNLHPENQRRIARLFSRIVKLGIKVFITTHSDYIIKELNTLIMLKQNHTHLKSIMQEEEYVEDELISANAIRVYIAKAEKVLLNDHKRKTNCHTLVPARIDTKTGIEAPSFDATIDEMNRIQDAILWGEE